MSYGGGQKVQKVMVQPINLLEIRLIKEMTVLNIFNWHVVPLSSCVDVSVWCVLQAAGRSCSDVSVRCVQFAPTNVKGASQIK